MTDIPYALASSQFVVPPFALARNARAIARLTYWHIWSGCEAAFLAYLSIRCRCPNAEETTWEEEI